MTPENCFGKNARKWIITALQSKYARKKSRSRLNIYQRSEFMYEIQKIRRVVKTREMSDQ